MNTEWQGFLQQQGALLHDSITQHFGNLSEELVCARDGNIVCPLGQYGLLKVTGEDAAAFMQNLFSNDLREVTLQRAQFSSFNTAKGRMLATFLISRNAEAYYLHLPRPLVAPILKKLTLYVLRSKVTLSDVSDQSISLGVAGDRAADALSTFASVPQEAWTASQSGSLSLIRLGTQRYLIVVPATDAPDIWNKLVSNGMHPSGSPCWDWLTIRAGLPVILPETQELFVPQMANLELIGGVNFKKGCYPGQEIVARMQYLGKPKRRLYLAHVASTAAAGNELFSSAEEQACGAIVNAAPSPDGGYDVLSVIQISSHAAQDVRLASPQGEKLQFLPLPYALPD